MNTQELFTQAQKALQKSYSPYSNFKVGAALMTKQGKTYTGCNIENASFGATNCAERTAFFKAVSEGETDFEAIAVTALNKDGVEVTATPCGICRQVMAEFCSPDEFYIILAKSIEEKKIFTLEQLFPESFKPSHIG